MGKPYEIEVRANESQRDDVVGVVERHVRLHRNVTLYVRSCAIGRRYSLQLFGPLASWSPSSV